MLYANITHNNQLCEIIKAPCRQIQNNLRLKCLILTYKSMSIEQKGGQPPDAESGDKFKKADDAALAKVEGGQSETEWFLPFEGAQINEEECTVELLKDHNGVYAIV